MPSTSEISQKMVESFIPDKAQGVDAVIQFDLAGDNGGQFWLEINDGNINANDGLHDSPKMTVKSTTEDWYAVSTGQLNAMQAFMSGKIKIQGDMSLAMKMQSMFKTG